MKQVYLRQSAISKIEKMPGIVTYVTRNGPNGSGTIEQMKTGIQSQNYLHVYFLSQNLSDSK